MNNHMYTTIPPELEDYPPMSPDEEMQDYLNNHPIEMSDEELDQMYRELWGDD